MKMSGFAMRWFFALLVVFITFNPTGISFSHWVWPLVNDQVPLKILAGLVLFGCYVVYLNATFRSLGLMGIFLVVAFCATIIWLFVDQGWMDWRNGSTMSWVMIVIISSVMGLGVSWSHIKKKLTGQFDTDDIGD